MRSRLSNIADNDDQAFLVGIYKDYFGFVKRTIIKITGSHNDVDDLVNDSFLKLIEKLQTIRLLSREQLTTYIKFTARSIAINYARHRDVVNKYVDVCAQTDLPELNVPSGPGIDEHIVQENELAELSRAITRLPEKQKNILYFKYLLDMTDEQISEVYSISANSVRTYLSRARKDAKKLMLEGIENGK